MTWELIRSRSCGPVIHGQGFVAIDLASAYSQHSFICQIGLVKVRDGILGKTHAHYVRPPPCRQNFGHHNVAIHGITRRMVDNAGGSGLMLPRLTAFTGDPSPGGPKYCRRTVHDPDFRGDRCRPPPYTSYCRKRAAEVRLPGPRTGNTGASSSSPPRQRNGAAGTLLPV